MTPSQTPIEEKKTFCWLEAVRDCQEIKRLMPHTTIVNISDREADFFEMFDDQRNNSTGVELLVRAKHDRVTNGEHKLFETARLGEIAAQIEIKIPRQSARSKKTQQPPAKSRWVEVTD